MTDTVSPEKRRQVMAAVKSRHTKPELTVRKWLHSLGYRFRLHFRKLPGSPDIVLPKYRTVVFVHGCFWHSHRNCPAARIPKTRPEWWTAKFERNVKRDAAVRDSLEKMGWRVVVVWECEVKNGAFKSILAGCLPPRSKDDQHGTGE